MLYWCKLQKLLLRIFCNGCLPVVLMPNLPLWMNLWHIATGRVIGSRLLSFIALLSTNNTLFFSDQEVKNFIFMRPDLGAGEDGEDVHHVEHLLLQGEAGAQLPGCGHPRQGELHDHHEDKHSRKCDDDGDDDDGQNPCFGEWESARFRRTHLV